MANSETPSLAEAPPSPQAPAAPPAAPQWKTILKIVGVIAVIAGLLLLGKQGEGLITQFAAWVQGLGFWGPVAFVIGYIVATVAFLPGAPLTIAAGFLFGLVGGTLFVFIGSTIGASLCFLISRYLAREWVERKLAAFPKFATIDQAVAKQGLKIVLLLRLSPIFPFNLLNYALGLTQVRFLDYLIGSVGMLPGTFLYVYGGKVAGDLAMAGAAQQKKGLGDWLLLGAGLLATVLVTALVTRIARRALKEETLKEEANV